MDDSEEGEEQDIERAYTQKQVQSGVFYGQAGFYPERVTGGFIKGRRDGQMVAATAFPQRPLKAAGDIALKVRAAALLPGDQPAV